MNTKNANTKNANKIDVFVNIVPTIIITLLALSNKSTLIKINTDAQFQFNLVMLLTVFCGFLFTSSSILLAIANADEIKDNKKIKDTNILQKRNEYIHKGIQYGLVSIFSALIILLTDDYKVCDEILFALYVIEIYYFFMLLIYFLKSVNSMNKLTEYFTEKITEGKISDSERDIEKEKRNSKKIFDQSED